MERESMKVYYSCIIDRVKVAELFSYTDAAMGSYKL